MATLPLHVPALVDSLSGSNYTFYGIRMYGRVVIVQADALPAYAKYHLPDDGGALPHEMTLQDTLDAQRQRVHDIDIIQSQLTTIKWQTISWAYLDRKGCRLIQRNRKMYQIASPTWTTLIEEGDITLTKIIDLYHRQGTWQGKQVEVFRGWTDESLYHIERGMRAFRELERRGLLDFTHDILGHIVSDGQVVGYITEPMTGRMVECCDQKVVYSAVARMHAAGLSYTGFTDSGLMITDTKVKLTNLPGLLIAREEDKRLDWESVEELFNPDCRGIPNLFIAPKDAVDEYTVLSITPDPERLFDSNLFSFQEILAPAFRRWQERCLREEKRRKRAKREKLLQGLDGSTACSSGSVSVAGSSRAPSGLSEAASTSSTVTRFHPYGEVMRHRLKIFVDGEESGAPSEGSGTLVASSRGVPLAPFWE
ncbi:hypothetical protein K523DRAFT_349352 [Schizophyllum commune Tattone D]|nr:hypothetical protein K523DRAFT_349352 [Schizophyllum commune Tattone D]